MAAKSSAEFYVWDNTAPILDKHQQDMDVSENSGFSPQIIHFNRGFPLFSPSILGAHPYFWKHPNKLKSW